MKTIERRHNDRSDLREERLRLPNEALRWALMRCNPDKALRVLAQPGKHAATDYDQAVVLASTQGYVDIVKVLINEKDADPSAMSNRAIRMASRYGRLETVRLLLQDKRVDPSDVFNSAVIEASTNGHVEVVRLLLQDKRVNPSSLRNTALVQAATKGHAEVVRLLLQDGRVDPSDKSNASICLACQGGHGEVVRILLQDPRVVPHDTCLVEASKNGYADVVALLLADGRPDPASSGQSAIRKAVSYGRTEVTRLLLQDKRVDPTTHYNDPMRTACFNGNADILRLLLQDPRVDPTAEDNHVIKSTSRNTCTKCLLLLLEDGRADPVASLEGDTFRLEGYSSERKNWLGQTRPWSLKLLLLSKRFCVAYRKLAKDDEERLHTCLVTVSPSSIAAMRSSFFSCSSETKEVSGVTKKRRPIRDRGSDSTRSKRQKTEHREQDAFSVGDDTEAIEYLTAVCEALNEFGDIPPTLSSNTVVDYLIGSIFL